jgi:hypothetical protein
MLTHFPDTPDADAVRQHVSESQWAVSGEYIARSRTFNVLKNVLICIGLQCSGLDGNKKIIRKFNNLRSLLDFSV